VYATKPPRAPIEVRYVNATTLRWLNATALHSPRTVLATSIMTPPASIWSAVALNTFSPSPRTCRFE
jgi:hypothetical protein